MSTRRKSKAATRPRSAKPGRPRPVYIETIEYDPQNQARVQLNNDTVVEYADAMERKEKLPPIVCYHDGSTYWLADGFHRYHAARKRSEKWIDAQVIKGSRDDARWHAAGANTAHGLKRNERDKQRAVRLAIELRPTMSDRAIAEHCGVSHPFVGKVRSGIAATGNGYQSDAPTLRTGADGRTINTANIGRRPEPRAQATESPVEPSDPWEDSEGEDEPAAAPVKAAAAPAKPARVDGKGRVIPENIAEAFLDQRADVNEWLADFRAISERLLGQRTKSGYASLAWPEIEAALLRVANAVRAEALPYAVCPYCSGDGCDACKGNGWLPRAGWQCVAPELAVGGDESAAAPAKRAALLDAEGAVVPEGIAADYAEHRSDVAGLVRDVKAVAAEVLGRKDKRGYHRVTFPIPEAALETIVSTLKLTAAPHAVCPYCKGDARGCDPCQGHGWLTKGHWEILPSSIREGKG